MSVKTAPMAELVPFRFEIPEEHLVAARRKHVDRLMAFINDRWIDGAELEQVREFDRPVSVVKGRLPQPCVTAIQALAMGHDLGRVLDLLEK